MRSSRLLLLACLFPAAVLAQKPPKPPKTAVSGATVARVVRTLAADELRGRASGQPGNQQAAEFLAAEFKRLKLQPLPGQTGYMQEFEAYEAATTVGPAVLQGTALPPENVAVLSGRAQVRWTSGGPARTLVVGPQDKLFQQLRPLLDLHEDVVVLVDAAQAKAFQQLKGYLDHQTLQAAKPAEHTVALLLAPTDFPGPLTAGTSYQVQATTAIRPVKLRNVVGVLPGRDKTYAAEQVVFSAHYDHIGLLPAVAGDSIANGADDDASGTAAVVALAEYFKKQKDNARTLVFVAFTAEEIGGFGSQYFSRQLDADKVVAMFNIEMIGKPAVFGPSSAFITGFDKSDFGQLLQQNLQGTPFRFEPDPYPAQNLFYRSDNATLARLGVPAHSISTDQIPTDKLYHSVDDEVESLDLQNMTAVVEAVARSASGIVAGRQTPTRIAPEK